MATTGAKYATSAIWVNNEWSLSSGASTTQTTQAKAKPVINSIYTDYLETNHYRYVAFIGLNGFNFTELPQQAIITSYTFSIRGGPHVGNPVGGNRLYAQLGHDAVVTEWSNVQQQWAQNGTYSEIGEQVKFIDNISVGNTTKRTYSYTFDENNTNDLNGRAWMNQNIEEIKNNNIGLFLQCTSFDLYYVTLELEYIVPSVITTNVTPSGSGSIAGGGAYADGTSVTLTATPSSGYKFKQWQDGNTNSSRTITVSGNATYTATFEPDSFTISTVVSPNGTGTVTGGGTYNAGSTITLTATPNIGYKFLKWSDNNTSNPRAVTATSNTTYTAIFESSSQIYSGTTKIQKFYLGTTPIKKIFLGTKQIY